MINDYEINYCGLKNWWHSEFSILERKCIVETFKPIGINGEILLKKNNATSINNLVKRLGAMSSWFFKNNNDIALKILNKGEEYIFEVDDVLIKHFFFGNKILFYYPKKEINNYMLEMTLVACNQQIEISESASEAFKKLGWIPSHLGYDKSIIIEKKRGNYIIAIDLAFEAQKQGWDGDYANIIVKLRNQLNKPIPQTSTPTPDRYDQLERLAKLRDQGILSEEEFIREKQKVLG